MSKGGPRTPPTHTEVFRHMELYQRVAPSGTSESRVTRSKGRLRISRKDCYCR